MALTWPRQRRLTRRPQFTACYDRGERHYTRHFVVFALPRPAESAAGQSSSGRLGLAVTRKCGNAVERSRIKRVLREFFRLRQHDMPGMDIVITPKRHVRAGMVYLALVERELAPLLDSLRERPALPAGAGARTVCEPRITDREPA
ncbi:MAG: ribonuclease P protein component [Desulfovibrionaceae bacterium]|nr:ribonuclease P protein component [Desulfovibrionaceae bacterium]